MSKLLTYAKQFGITIFLENMPFLDFSLSSPTTIVDIVKEIDDPSFAMCLDTGHANCAGIAPAHFARLLGKRLIALHMHDNFAHDDAHSLIYMGNINWTDFAAALKEVDYNGWLNLEWGAGRFPKEQIYEAESFAFKTLRHFA